MPHRSSAPMTEGQIPHDVLAGHRGCPTAGYLPRVDLPTLLVARHATLGTGDRQPVGCEARASLIVRTRPALQITDRLMASQLQSRRILT